MITAVDVGATKVLVAQFHDDGRPLHIARFLTPKKVHDFLPLLHEHLSGFPAISSIVVGAPGIISSDGVIERCSNLPAWQHINLRHLLMERYNAPVAIENDAKLAGLAEINYLSPVPQLGLYLTVSTGIGSGIILDGNIHPAFRNSEAGRILMQFNGEWQQWQHFAAGSALAAYFGKQAHDFTRQSEWQETADRISRGLLVLIPTLQPEVIVIGGSIGAYFEHYDDYLLQKLHPLTPFISLPPILKARHPEEAVLYGCYYYARQQNR